ncbi:dihydrofolate reductase family protein [Sporichthya polymorpha]|uniref:dihydrofolate reductase family protein n=1 Tax=Sporichthya polymorpha TaxID=35751 RepID=UPI00037E402A|nr:dihydrofolate reductase family protein [Sporichthya polymorpha]
MISAVTPGPELDVEALAAAYAYPSEMPRGRWLRANMVGTADGAAMGGSGVTRQISNPNDLGLLLLLRSLSDVVLVGPRTVRAESYGPARTRADHAVVRGDRPPPPIAVMTSSLDLDFTTSLFTEPAVPTIVFTAETAPAEALAAARKVADVVIVGEDSVPLPAVVDHLVDRGHARLLCEGGPGILASMAADGLLDELCLALSPILAGGRAGRIMRGPDLGGGLPLTLAHTLTDSDGFLFLRYLVQNA